MTGYELESYENGMRYAQSIAKNYGTRGLAVILQDARNEGGDMPAPHMAWVTGAVDTAIELITTEQARKANDDALIAATGA